MLGALGLVCNRREAAVKGIADQRIAVEQSHGARVSFTPVAHCVTTLLRH